MAIEKDFYMPVYRILISPLQENVKRSKLETWLYANHKQIKLSTLRSSFRKAGRDDLINEFIEDVDIEVGDNVQSRSTARKGKVTEIKSDNETIIVKWDTGGVQMLSKDGLIKLNSTKDNSFDKKDISNIKTPFPGYDRHSKEDIMIDNQRDVRVLTK